MRTRAGAYAWIVEDGRILLTCFQGMDLTTGEPVRSWTLPGGGMEIGEQCEDTVLREVAEETGYEVAVGPLLGVNNVYLQAELTYAPELGDLHSIQVVHSARVVGGEFQIEVDGSTVDAGWFPLDEPMPTDRVPLIDAANAFAARAGLPTYEPGPRRDDFQTATADLIARSRATGG